MERKNIAKFVAKAIVPVLIATSPLYLGGCPKGDGVSERRANSAYHYGHTSNETLPEYREFINE